VFEFYILDGVNVDARNAHKELHEFIYSRIRREIFDKKIASLLVIFELKNSLGDLLLLESISDVELLSIDYLLIELLDSPSSSVGNVEADESQKSLRNICLHRIYFLDTNLL